MALISAGAAALYGLLQHFGLDPLVPATFYPDRVVSTFENPNYFGNYVAILLPVGIALFLRAENWRILLGAYILLGLIYAGLLVAGSRGAWWGGLTGGAILIGGYGL